MFNKMDKKILKKLLDNINYSKCKGMIIASPSNNPPYKYHWVRDASLVMRVIIDCYKQTKKNKYLLIIINYLENCLCIQNLQTKSGLGEPKININRTPYNEPWGRPQNDGPALRGLNMIELYKLLKKDYPNLVKNMVLQILEKDINYILTNYNKICFDLWEEIKGWHFYTRIVQLKFIKEFLKIRDQIKNMITINVENVNLIYNKLYQQCKHHIGSDNIISSFNEYGEIIRCDDASVLLAFCHVNFDKEYLDLFTIAKLKKTSDNLLDYFRKKYNNYKLNMIGRYPHDKYYKGQIWILCTLAMVQFYIVYSNKFNDKKVMNTAKQIVDFIRSIDINFNLAEQYNPNTNEMLSAKKLTWNYSEFYFTQKLLK